MRIAAIDVGTNTVQLLVAEQTEDGLCRLHAGERFVRLGEGVDASGKIDSAAQERLMDALDEHVQAAQRFGVDNLIVGGTSALRDAENREKVVGTIQNRLGVSVDILSGREEATWSFAAACSAFDDLDGPVVVVDIGGGSTELVVGQNPSSHHPEYGEAITDRASLDLGCVRLTERYFSSQPPSPTSVEEVERVVDRTLYTATLPLPARITLIATAGTATALALVDRGPDSTWDALRGAGFSLTAADVRHWRNRLLHLSVGDILQLHPKAMSGRADVFPVGVLLLDRIMCHLDAGACRVSPFELRHGLVLRLLADPSCRSTQYSS